MSPFKTKKIRKKPPLQPLKKAKNGLIKCKGAFSGINKKHGSYLLGLILIIVAAFIVIKVMGSIYNAVINFSPKNLVFALGEDLKQDKNGYTNIVILGDGGYERAGAGLVDSIMVVSIDFKNNSVSLLSLPRDLYVKTENYGSEKINSFYIYNSRKMNKEAAYQTYQEIIGDIVNLDIQYYMRLDFNAFVEVIDSLGGVTVDVKKAIYDPYYPDKYDQGYATFSIKAGLQNLDGETALKFARSRKTTSDFDRAARQQQILLAVKNKALSAKVLTSPKTITNVYNAVKSNINTNMELREMISLAEFATKIDNNKMIRKVIHDDPSRDGGFLYTPERKYYGDQFVLVPYGNNYDLIHRYTDLIFNHRDIVLKNAKIEILNGTKKTGFAGQTAIFLQRFGFNIVDTNNYKDDSGKKKYAEKTFIRFNGQKIDEKGNITNPHQDTLKVLSSFISGTQVASSEAETNDKVDISIILGDDYHIK